MTTRWFNKIIKKSIQITKGKDVHTKTKNIQIHIYMQQD